MRWWNPHEAWRASAPNLGTMDVRRLASSTGFSRALVLLGLLTGLFAMHGMAANHETLAVVAHHAANGHLAPHTAMADPAAGAHAGAGTTQSPPSEDGGGHPTHPTMEMCLAVLVGFGVLVLMLMAGRAGRRSTPRTGVTAVRGWPAAAGRGRRFSLTLTELSTSRT
jgi:hypothetical protein